MTNKKTKFKKLVFFDEQAALDILDVEQGGSTERIVKGAKEFAAGVDGSAQAGMGFFSSLKVKLSGNAKASVTNLIETQLKSTILTDFLTLIDKKTVFVDIENYKLRLTDDSTAYFRTLFRYLRMVKDVKGLGDQMKSSEDRDNIQSLSVFDLPNIDNILDEATGYYQFIGENKIDDSKEMIIRFNYEGIRNNYKLTDLTKMDLRIIGIKVGEVNSLDISLDSDILISANSKENKPAPDAPRDFISDQENNKSKSTETIQKESKKNAGVKNEKQYDVIDVVLAGVC